VTESREAVLPDRQVILLALQESYRGPAWHGPSVREALDGVTAPVASNKLRSGRNSIWELVLHLAHGRHLLIERITNAPVPDFPRAIREPWWPIAATDRSEQAWRNDVALLDRYQETLIESIERASADQLARVPSGSEPIARQLLGMALHDAYHAGQIRLLALAFVGGEGSV
jgi:hypothetical protein